MEQTVRIYGANKNVRKTFSTPKEATEYIDENNLFPGTKGKNIKLEITQVKYRTVQREFPDLSKSIKETFIQTLFDNFNSISFSELALWVEMYRVYDKKGKKSTSTLKCAVFDFIQGHYGFSDEEMFENFCDKNYMDLGFKVIENKFPELFDSEFRKKHAPGIIKSVVEQYDIKDVKFKYNSTNYKPCHNISIEFGGDKDYGDLIFQIRANDVIYGHGRCYGRNVSLSSTVDLTDDRFETFFKTTKFSN